MTEEGFLRSPEMTAARKQEAEVNTAAAMLVRIAMLHDDTEKGDLRGALARIELGVSRVADRKYQGHAMNSDIVERIRGK